MRFVNASTEIDYDDFFYHGDGTARGGEVLVQRRSGRQTGWVSYTLSKVEETFPTLETGEILKNNILLMGRTLNASVSLSF